MLLKVLAVLAVLLAGFVYWRWTSVKRGADQRDEKLLAQLDPVGKKFDAGAPVSREEIEALAARPELRYVMYPVFRHMNKSDLLPGQYNSTVSQGEAALAYWMMHPNELQAPPAAIEWVETVKRPYEGQERDFHVYRFRMAAGHWAEKDGWILGLAGPMKPEQEPYAELPGAFSRVSDIDGKIAPDEIVDWYLGLLKQKGVTK